jgi:pimeloyl-ACP methyl ester carboxylesterase
VKAAVARRIGLSIPQDRTPPRCVAHGSLDADGFAAEKLTLEAEPGVELPALLLVPKKATPRKTVVLHASELGKPTRCTSPSLALELVRKGHVVLSIDVRGAGETDPRDRSTLRPLTHYDAQQFRFDGCAVRAARLGTTMLAMRARDIVRAIDYLAARRDLSGRPVVLVGEGLGGLWTLVAAAFDPRPAGVICVKTVPSYKLIVASRYYRTRDYFWVPGALKDFDIPDLPALIAPRPTVLIDPVDAMLEPLSQERADRICHWPRGVCKALGTPGRLSIRQTPNGTTAEAAEAIAAVLAAP